MEIKKEKDHNSLDDQKKHPDYRHFKLVKATDPGTLPDEESADAEINNLRDATNDDGYTTRKNKTQPGSIKS